MGNPNRRGGKPAAGGDVGGTWSCAHCLLRGIPANVMHCRCGAAQPRGAQQRLAREAKLACGGGNGGGAPARKPRTWSTFDWYSDLFPRLGGITETVVKDKGKGKGNGQGRAPAKR